MIIRTIMRYIYIISEINVSIDMMHVHNDHLTFFSFRLSFDDDDDVENRYTHKKH